MLDSDTVQSKTPSLFQQQFNSRKSECSNYLDRVELYKQRVNQEQQIKLREREQVLFANQVNKASFDADANYQEAKARGVRIQSDIDSHDAMELMESSVSQIDYNPLEKRPQTAVQKQTKAGKGILKESRYAKAS